MGTARSSAALHYPLLMARKRDSGSRVSRPENQVSHSSPVRGSRAASALMRV